MAAPRITKWLRSPLAFRLRGHFEVRIPLTEVSQLRDQAIQALALNQLHGVVVDATFHTDTVNCHDVRMIQRGRHPEPWYGKSRRQENNTECWARLTPNKRIDLLLNAFRIVRKKREDVCLIIIGDGPEQDELMELAKWNKPHTPDSFLSRFYC